MKTKRGKSTEELTAREIVRALRERGLSYIDIAQKVGIASTMSVYNWENGKNPTVRNLKALGDLFEGEFKRPVIFKLNA